ncbi:MAG: ABC transporter ATP-binding protein [Schleiferiaceae bacterium]
MIEVRELTKIYTGGSVETVALKSISLSIKAGEFVSVMGPSGCGKSTFLNLLGLLDNPTAGSYEFCGQSVARLSEKEKAQLRKEQVGFIFQNFNLIEELTVYENIELPLIYLKKKGAERKERVTEVLRRLNLEHRAQYFPQQLSGGQQQRVAVGRAIVTEPRLILADEPTGNLDTVHGNEVMEIITELNEMGTTVVMVTHSDHDASYSKRVVRLLDGEIISENTLIHT